jgi:hypothetical protein
MRKSARAFAFFLTGFAIIEVQDAIELRPRQNPE